MITTLLTTWFFDFLTLALTPTQRWQAARKFDVSSDAASWFIWIGGIALVLLTILFSIVSILHLVKGRKFSKQLFFEYSNQRGLSERERQILLRLTNSAGLKQSGAIFTMSRTFDSEAVKLVDESLSLYGDEASKKLISELSFLREKLGFKTRSSSIGSVSKPKKMTSRRIPVEKNVYIRQPARPELGEIETKVIENNNMKFVIEVNREVETKIGEVWCVRCNFGAAIWEFDTTVISSNVNNLVLNHSDDIRFINRREFPRVSVNRPAFIARFPFIYSLGNDFERQVDENTGIERKLPDMPLACEKPEFVPVVIKELAGPGLRLDTAMELKVGERILVVFNLEEKQVQRTIQRSEDELANREMEDEERFIKVTTVLSRLVEDIAEVRNVKAVANGFSVSVELTGLTDFDVSELVRVTNIASIKYGDDEKSVEGNIENQASNVARDEVTQEV